MMIIKKFAAVAALSLFICTATFAQVKVACVGASITEGYGIDNPTERAYPGQLQALLGRRYQIANFGVGGTTLLRSGDSPYWDTPAYQDALKFNPDIVFIDLGGNDAKAVNRAHYNELVRDCQAMVQSFQALPSKPRVILLLPFKSFETDTNQIWDKVIVNEIAPRMRQAAVDEGIEVLDMHTLLINQPALYIDKIHPGEKAAGIVARRLAEQINQEFDTKYDVFKQLDRPFTSGSFYGYAEASFTLNGRECKVVKPKRVANDRPWVWRARFWGHEPQADIALLERGYHIAYCDAAEMLGNEAAISLWNMFHEILYNAGLNRKALFEGMSRGGVYALNWAAANPDKVAGVYVDNPLLDMRAYALLKKGIAGDIRQAHGLATDEAVAGFMGSPMDRITDIVRGNYPILILCADADEAVDPQTQTLAFEKKVKAAGGDITVIMKPGFKHHPHAFPNPAPIVDFMLKATVATSVASSRTGDIRAEWVDRTRFSSEGNRPAGKNVLWYKQSARVWEEALPIGNGRLGAMVFGGVADERIQLNESSLWDGYALDPNNPESLKTLPEVRNLLFENKNNEAVKLAEQTMMGRPRGVKPYQSLGELWFDTPHLAVTDYTRSLDLATGIVTVRYRHNGIWYTRETFASADHQAIIVRFTADKGGKITGSFTLRRQQDAVVEQHPTDAQSLLLKGRLPVKDADGNARGIRFAAQLKAVTAGGRVAFHDDVMAVTDADTLTLYIAGATNHPGLDHISAIHDFSGVPEDSCAATIARAMRQPYEAVKTAQIREHQQYYGRTALELAVSDEKGKTMATDELLDDARKTGQLHPSLVETYFQYGRYLLIASSRPGTMPANLQGLWAWQMNPPWNADYHTNINLQMNYWPAEIANLPEMHLPLFDLTEALVTPGKRTANVLYGADGWVVHHLTDAWGFTAPADGPQGIWPMGAAWLAQHPWEHYCYTLDTAFLRQRAYPLMKGAATFILDFLVEAPAGTPVAGKLVTNPSYSPENAFFLPNGEQSVFTYGATMDLEIIHDLLTNCIAATKLLGIDKDFREMCLKTLSQLAPIRISETTGRIMEWVEDYKEVEPHHRHTSHLFALHPGNQISVTGTPELAEAARKTLIARGDDGTGWGLAWKINMWNRLHDGDHAYKLLGVLLREKTLPNLFDNHPPFQIDGNFGATAAIAEMLVQSHVPLKGNRFEVHLLPSLPTDLANGSIKGLRARGGFAIDLSWENGTLKEARIFAEKGGKLTLRLGGRVVNFKTKKGETLELNGSLKRI
ncbi:glycosyl hydrolase family 95 catalytic domain-containing protein [Parapedobacter pyrenivorans]|uniref:glycosyl hydrolase family 95 catalytic domain-containing protein n=1 Tax=Parapedobacter pyrenivorans TaxID=1305674 RepID=UPI003341207C